MRSSEQAGLSHKRTESTHYRWWASEQLAIKAPHLHHSFGVFTRPCQQAEPRPRCSNSLSFLSNPTRSFCYLLCLPQASGTRRTRSLYAGLTYVRAAPNDGRSHNFSRSLESSPGSTALRAGRQLLESQLFSPSPHRRRAALRHRGAAPQVCGVRSAPRSRTGKPAEAAAAEVAAATASAR